MLFSQHTEIWIYKGNLFNFIHQTSIRMLLTCNSVWSPTQSKVKVIDSAVLYDIHSRYWVLQQGGGQWMSGVGDQYRSLYLAGLAM